MQRPPKSIRKTVFPERAVTFRENPHSTAPRLCHKNQLARQSAQLCRRRQWRDCVGRLATEVKPLTTGTVHAWAVKISGSNTLHKVAESLSTSSLVTCVSRHYVIVKITWLIQLWLNIL